MDRFVTTLASLSLMVLALIASVQAASDGPDFGPGGEGNGDFGGGPADFF